MSAINLKEITHGTVKGTSVRNSIKSQPINKAPPLEEEVSNRIELCPERDLCVAPQLCWAWEHHSFTQNGIHFRWTDGPYQSGSKSQARTEVSKRIWWGKKIKPKGNPNSSEINIRGETLRNQLIVAYTLKASLHISVVSEEGVVQGVCAGVGVGGHSFKVSLLWKSTQACSVCSSDHLLIVCISNPNYWLDVHTSSAEEGWWV